MTDPNEIAHRIVKEATGDDDRTPCPECGAPLTRETVGQGRFGDDRQSVAVGSGAWVCANGHRFPGR